ncbi:hypothetical protein JE952_000800 [Flavobacterium psychrophilum]|nr:hypothetical protein [Flavobacterium psychrophilum]ELI6455811.1 hypothetical protein [Flavobacterium psychrophilum]
MMNSKKHLKEFYNYKYWREIQRNQLTTSSNIVFTFCIAAVGFIINYLLNNKCLRCPILNDLFFYSILFFLLSTITYLILNIVKLKDYRETAKLIKKNTPFHEISKQTFLLGKLSWWLLISEIIFAFFGFIISLFIFKNIIFL